MTKEKRQYVIVRAAQAGCFAGVLVSRKGSEVILNECRRLWYWAGAASLSELAMEGTSKPSECMFPPATQQHLILGVIEVIPTSDKGKTSIEGVAPWRS
jgi:hypothetical protein